MEDKLKTIYKKVEGIGRYRFEEWLELLNGSLQNYEYDIDDNHLIIKIPDTICTDSYGNKTSIKGLYFQYVFYSEYYTFHAIRSQLELKQYHSSYIHSHISGSPFQWTSNICFGNVNISGTFIEHLVKFMSIVEYFVQNESSFTRPYRKITDITGKSIVKGVIYTRHDYSYNSYVLEQYIVQNRRVISIKLNDDLLNEILEHEPVIEDNGKFYKINTDLPIPDLGFVLFTFKGEPVKAEIYREDENIKYNFIPNPYRVNQIKQLILENYDNDKID